MEKSSHFNKEPGVQGELTMRFDTASGEMRIDGFGTWSVPQAVAFFEEWRRAVGRVHKSGRPVSALVDLRKAATQRPDVTEVIAKGANSLYVDGDAVATIVPTSLAKMRLRGILDTRFHNFFLSPSAAESWLKGRLLLIASGPKEQPALPQSRPSPGIGAPAR